MSNEKQTFQHGDGWCKCNCIDGEIGVLGCLFTTCCPCFALCNAANDAGLKNGTLYCIATACGFGCCSLMFLGQEVEEKRGLKKHGDGWHGCHSCFDTCSCHSCRVVNECQVLAKEGATVAPSSDEMERK